MGIFALFVLSTIAPCTGRSLRGVSTRVLQVAGEAERTYPDCLVLSIPLDAGDFAGVYTHTGRFNGECSAEWWG